MLVVNKYNAEPVVLVAKGLLAAFSRGQLKCVRALRLIVRHA